MKQCRFCAEEIQDAAIKCRYCGSELSVAPTATPAKPTSSASTRVETRSRVGTSTDCPHCAHTLAVGDAQCSHCETPLTWVFGDPLSIWEKRFSPLHALVALGFALVLLYFINGAAEFVSPGSRVISSPPKAATGDYSNMAVIICKDFVKQRLKAPGSADFPWLDFTSRSEGADAYGVTSYVDAQNGFGAKLRSAWSCRVRYTGGDRGDIQNWSLLDITIGE